MKTKWKLEYTKIRYAKCAQCSTKTETTKLYLVMDKKICLACGNAEIAKWNELVKEGETPPT